MKIGPHSLIDNTPQLVEVQDSEYVLTTTEDGDPVLYSTECPHRGAKVELNDGCLRCPWHGWEFDASTGDVTNIQDEEKLDKIDVSSRDGKLYAEISQTEPTVDFSVADTDPEEFTIKLLSHATLAIEYEGFTLVTDPWLDGPAMLDSWVKYPAPTCDVDRVAADTDAIWITHEHSDHLHPRTLAHFPSDTPIYVPELNAFRLSDRLQDLGFENVHSLPTEKAYPLTDNIEVVCFESKSSFNDSVQVINCGGFRILNAHDAGVDWRVKEAVSSVDLVATEFSAGAGDYPAMWNHVSADDTRDFVAEKNKQKINEFELFVDLFDPDYLLPFAKFMERPQPSQQARWELVEKNRPKDIVDKFKDRPAQVLDLLPGESWDATRESIDRRQDREKFFSSEFKEEYLKTAYQAMNPVVDTGFELDHNKLATYFESMGGSQLAEKIGDLALTLVLTGENSEMYSLVRIQHGKIEYTATDTPVQLGAVDADYHIRMRCPGDRVQFVIDNDLSWDDIKLGWWAECDRQPDEHNDWFWRMLHAPWEARDDMMRVADRYDFDTKLAGIPIADLIEKHGVQETLSDYGLYCVGCSQGIAEDIVEAARIHGLNDRKAEQLIREVETDISA